MTHASARVLALAGTLLLAGLASAHPTHSRQFWNDLAAAEFKVPGGAEVGALALEAAELLGSTDGSLRDGIASEALAAWIYPTPRLAAAELVALREALLAQARRDLGSGEGDGVFRRSFSLLVLSVIAAADLKGPLLNDGARESLLALALEALGHERDLRGYVPGKGWAHATAHTADLLKFLARSPALTEPQQARIVAAVAERLRSAGMVFVYGEDARLAAALAALAGRPDAASRPFLDWFARLAGEHRRLWQGEFDAAAYVAVRAQLNALAHLAVVLERTPAAPAAIREGLGALLAAAD